MSSRFRVADLIGVATVACLGLMAPGLLAQEPPRPQPVEIPSAATLEGVPTVRVDSSEEGTTRRVLDLAQASTDRLTVTARDGKLFWTSRGNRQLRLFSSGEFTYLTSEPGKYIRLTRLNDRISYVEHLDTVSGTVTWWGELRIVGK